MAKIFISYSRSDRQFLDNFIPLVRRVYGNDSLWFDDDIHGGADWWKLILSEVGGCELFIYLISNESLESPYCQAELEEALRLQKQILPVIVRRLNPAYPGNAPENLAVVLRRTQFIDMASGFRDANIIANLYAAINRLLAQVNSQPPVPITPQPVPQPAVKDKKSWWDKLTEGQGTVIAAVVGAIAVIIAALIALFGVVLPMLNPTETPTQPSISMAQAATTEPVAPTETPLVHIAATITIPLSQETETDIATATLTFTPSSSETDIPDPLMLAQQGVSRNDEWTSYTQEFDGVEMVLVPKGCFMMGSTDEQIDYAVALSGDPDRFVDEQPVYEICFNAPFWIDQTEVTQAQFRRFGGIVARTSFSTGDDHPVENITWFEARDFCELRDARLPTEAEWEYAARGPEALIYPWGNELNANNAVWNRHESEGTANVASIPTGVSWVGALDMSGNVWEWVSSLYLDYPYGSDHESIINGTSTHVLRGGSWRDNTTSSFRAAFRNANNPNNESNITGFRCARDFDG